MRPFLGHFEIPTARKSIFEILAIFGPILAIFLPISLKISPKTQKNATSSNLEYKLILTTNFLLYEKISKNRKSKKKFSKFRKFSKNRKNFFKKSKKMESSKMEGICLIFIISLCRAIFCDFGHFLADFGHFVAKISENFTNFQ